MVQTLLGSRVIDPTPPGATPPVNHLLIFSHASLETVGDRYGSWNIFSPNCPVPSFICTFGSSDIYGAGPFASTPNCPTIVILSINHGGNNGGGRVMRCPHNWWTETERPKPPWRSCCIDTRRSSSCSEAEIFGN
jgi:hypothetical protein